MKTTRCRAHWLILFVVFGSACSSMPQGASHAGNGVLDERAPALNTTPTARTSEGVFAPLGKVAIGEVATLSADNPLGVTRARVVDEYAAASGRLCRRVTIAEREPRLRLVCRTPDGNWSMVRGLVATK